MKTFKTSKGTELSLMNLRGKDYLAVAQRIIWFREENPDWTIFTTRVEGTMDYSIFKAEIADERGRIRAMAHKCETAQGFADHLEKAETGAIGRALALCGFGTQFAQEDFDERDRIVDAPIQEPRSAAPTQLKPVSDAQLKRMFAISQNHGWSPDEVRELILKETGKNSSKELDRAEYDLICHKLEQP